MVLNVNLLINELHVSASLSSNTKRQRISLVISAFENNSDKIPEKTWKYIKWHFQLEKSTTSNYWTSRVLNLGAWETTSEHFKRVSIKFFPSVRSHGTLAMIMVNLAKSWLTMVPLPRSWLIMIHGTLAKIMARSWQDLDKITMVRHVSWY